MLRLSATGVVIAVAFSVAALAQQQSTLVFRPGRALVMDREEVDRLPPGAYLLTLESTLRSTIAKREVRFDVVK